MGEEQFDEEETNEEAGLATRGGEGTSEETEVQFETLKDALSELNNKKDRTRADNQKLIRAMEIMEDTRRFSIDDRDDPVLMAAYNRAQMGQKVFERTYETRNGFKFSNVL
jgi:hypothetical protein